MRQLPRCEILQVQVQADGPWRRRGLAGLAIDAIALLIHLAVAMDEQGGSQRQLGMLGQEVPGHQTEKRIRRSLNGVPKQKKTSAKHGETSNESHYRCFNPGFALHIAPG